MALLLGAVPTGCSRPGLTEAMIKERLLGEIVTFENARYPYFEFDETQDLHTQVAAQKGNRKKTKVVATVDVVDRAAAVECAGNLLLTLDWTDDWNLRKIRPVKPHPFTCRPLDNSTRASISKSGDANGTNARRHGTDGAGTVSPQPPAAGSQSGPIGEFVDETGSRLQRFRDIDAYVRSLPKAKSIDEVVGQLRSHAGSDWEKVRAAFIWMTENVEYDVDSYFGDLGNANVSAEGVFATGRSVCEGYASLFETILKKLGIDIVKLSGYAKGLSYSPGDRFQKTNHAWNAIKIDGAWHLFDSTWGAGSVDGKKFIKEYKEFWFDTPPELFVLSHLPEEPGWTLLNRTISLSEFEQMPYFKNGDISSLAGLGFDKNAILAGIESGSVPDAYNFPEHDIRVVTAPTVKKLAAGTEHRIVIESGDVDKFAIVQGDRWIHLTRQGNRFTGTFVASSGKTSVSANFGGNETRYWRLLGYETD